MNKNVASIVAVFCTIAPVIAEAQPTSPSLGAPIGPMPVKAQSANKAEPGLVGVPAAAATSVALKTPQSAAPPQTTIEQAAQPRTGAVGIVGIERNPSLGDWADLGDRRAYKAQLDKLRADETKAQPVAAPTMAGPIATMPPQAASVTTLAPQEKKRVRFSEACPDDDSPCFFSVYGLSMEDGTNNYHGQLAIKGRLIPGGVFKGKKFDGYTVTEITGSALTVIDKRGKKHVWPLYSASSFAADPGQLSNAKPESPTPAGGISLMSLPR